MGRADDIGQNFNASRPNSAASWGAIMAGALVAIAISLVLVTLGTGLGFASISPWPNHGLGVGAFTVTAAIWLIVTQWVSSLFGGYITGRLRTRWIGTHEHEIFFRDTANGLVTWALATVAVAALVASTASSAINGGAISGGAISGGGSAKMDLGVVASAAQVAEAASSRAPDGGAASAPDSARTGGTASARGGGTGADAARQDDVARKDAAEVAIYTALSMLIGAFIASVAAALGGRLRDEHL
jgi:hypothetical protein